MRLSERLVGRKSFVQPPFWTSLADGRQWISTLTPDKERIGNDFLSYVRGAYKDNGVVFSCMLTRQLLFSEARFQWREMRNGRPGNLFGSPELALLERPWPNGTTGELLSRMESDASLAGNFFGTTADDEGRIGKAATGPGRRVVRMRPDWVTIILGSKRPGASPYDIDTKVIAYEYRPPMLALASEATLLLPEEVCHFSPVPDPEARFRGMSWLTPVLREIDADRAASKHKLKFFEQGATLNHLVKLDKDVDPDEFDEFVARFKAQHEGVDTAYKTLFLGGGADVSVVGADMKQIDFKVTQGAGETRIAAAARVHPVVVGLSEGLQGSSLNAGNFKAAMRITADGGIRPLWRMAAASLQSLVKAPSDGAQLWYDDRDIAFLREDLKDVADVHQKEAITVRQYTDAGFTPESAVAAVQSGDMSRLEHSGLYSVQLHPPGTQFDAKPPADVPTDDPDDPDEEVA